MSERKEALMNILSLARNISAEDDDRFLMVLRQAKRVLGVTNAYIADGLHVSQSQIDRWLREGEKPPLATKKEILAWIEREAHRQLGSVEV